MSITDNATVYKFVLHFDRDCKPEDSQVRYVAATSEEEAIQKFATYLDKQAKAGFMKPCCYSYFPTVEIDYIIM